MCSKSQYVSLPVPPLWHFWVSAISATPFPSPLSPRCLSLAKRGAYPIPLFGEFPILSEYSLRHGTSRSGVETEALAWIGVKEERDEVMLPRSVHRASLSRKQIGILFSSCAGFNEFLRTVPCCWGRCAPLEKTPTRWEYWMLDRNIQK